MSDKPEYQRIVFRPEYVDLLEGDHLSALMLGQIVYWYLPGKTGKSKLRVQRDGSWWLVKSHVDWESELRMTRRQSQRCLEVLRSKSIIQTERYMFNGHPTVHLKLRLVCGNMIPIAQLDAFHCTLMGIPLHSEVQCITETTTETTTETLKQASENPDATEGENSMNIEQAMEKVKSRKPQTKPTAQSMALLWKRRMGTLVGGFIKDLTSKELGQMKLLIKSIGDQAPEVLDWTLQNWSVFAWEVKHKKGLSIAPEVPVVGFVLQHHEIAVQLIAKPAAKATTTPDTTPTPKIDKPLPVADSAPVQPKASQADVEDTLAILAQIGGS